ncbi:putative transmembrane protein [Gregarina niphandrodes]|uniref:Transmembrane protein n=1 Tax=Gregarina niphandrodes TaxID=110365 RepID=A0A023B075_GRENI|nr:putative transmembrane protein [Gregarina niphandrodes]EZG44985.1 putative transmembrane protein [Gregarina niphandrodes]|eukprot:XP_011132611.1 putative transmembrane protein [Gregarina niphandrodes]
MTDRTHDFRKYIESQRADCQNRAASGATLRANSLTTESANGLKQRKTDWEKETNSEKETNRLAGRSLGSNPGHNTSSSNTSDLNRSNSNPSSKAVRLDVPPDVTPARVAPGSGRRAPALVPYAESIRQLCKAVKQLDRLTPAVLRGPDASLYYWYHGLGSAVCGAACVWAPVRLSASGVCGTGTCAHGVCGTGKCAHGVSLAELKVLLEAVEESVEDGRVIDRLVEQRCTSERRGGWRGWFESTPAQPPDLVRHRTGMRAAVVAFVHELRRALKVYELQTLAIELARHDVLDAWRTSELPSDTDCALRYAESTQRLNQRAEAYVYTPALYNQVISEVLNDAQPTSLVRNVVHSTTGTTGGRTALDRTALDRTALDRTAGKQRSGVTTTDATTAGDQTTAEDRPGRSGTVGRLDERGLDERTERGLDVTDTALLSNPDELEIIAQANPQVQRLRVLQQQQEMDEDVVVDISRKIEKISDLMTFFVNTVDQQQSMTANILSMTDGAVGNVADAERQLAKALGRRLTVRRLLFVLYLGIGLCLLGLDFAKSWLA